MSMVINLVEDHNIYLCEGGPVYNGGVQPTPITYLTQWKIVGNSEVHGNEIWSCGEYNATDGKYHILVLPLGGSIADIALDAPLRKVNDVADTIEFPSDIEGKALVTRNLGSATFEELQVKGTDSQANIASCNDKLTGCYSLSGNAQSADIIATKGGDIVGLSVARQYPNVAISVYNTTIFLRNPNITQDKESYQSYATELGTISFIYELATPTTELVDAPQIEEADSYSMVISQGGKAVEWSSFETE